MLITGIEYPEFWSQNINFPYTLYITTESCGYVNFDPKMCNLFFNGSFNIVIVLS